MALCDCQRIVLVHVCFFASFHTLKYWLFIVFMVLWEGSKENDVELLGVVEVRDFMTLY